jgi:hypothetical protein
MSHAGASFRMFGSANCLAVFQITMALPLLVGAGLLARTLRNLLCHVSAIVSSKLGRSRGVFSYSGATSTVGVAREFQTVLRFETPSFHRT